MGAKLRMMGCFACSLLKFMGARMISHGQRADGSGQVGYATKRGTGVPPVTRMASVAMAPPSDTMSRGAGEGRTRERRRETVDLTAATWR